MTNNTKAANPFNLDWPKYETNSKFWIWSIKADKWVKKRVWDKKSDKWVITPEYAEIQKAN